MKKELEICAYCGAQEKKMTEEHIVPKGLFIKDHNVTIPVCYSCNSGKSKDDEYFRLVFAVLKESAGNKIAMKVIDKVKRSLSYPEQKSFKEMISRSSNNIFIKNDNGEVVINHGLKVEINRINSIFEFITKGLFYKEKGYRLTNEYQVFSTFGRENETEEGKENVKKFRKSLENKPWIEIGEQDVFKYRYHFPKADSQRSIWEMKIYNGISTISFISKVG